MFREAGVQQRNRKWTKNGGAATQIILVLVLEFPIFENENEDDKIRAGQVRSRLAPMVQSDANGAALQAFARKMAAIDALESFLFIIGRPRRNSLFRRMVATIRRC